MSNQYWTIEGFEQLTLQQIFDMAVEHIKTTRKKSFSNDTCLYGGSGCAASPLLKADCRSLADENHECGCINTSWRGLVNTGRVQRHNADFISELQSCHDLSGMDFFMRDWKDRMYTLARAHCLDPSKLNDIPN